MCVWWRFVVLRLPSCSPLTLECSISFLGILSPSGYSLGNCKISILLSAKSWAHEQSQINWTLDSLLVFCVLIRATRGNKCPLSPFQGNLSGFFVKSIQSSDSLIFPSILWGPFHPSSKCLSSNIRGSSVAYTQENLTDRSMSPHRCLCIYKHVDVQI